VVWCANAYEATQDADAVVILTEWNEFRALDLARMAAKMAAPRMADLRNVYAPQAVLQAGFDRYLGVGR
jgi:UDPglucose 6-dehydrogenase